MQNKEEKYTLENGKEFMTSGNTITFGDGGGGQFFIKTLTGRTITVKLDEAKQTTVNDVKGGIGKLLNVDPAQTNNIKLILNGKCLDGNKAFYDYEKEIQKSAALHVSLPLGALLNTSSTAVSQLSPEQWKKRESQFFLRTGRPEDDKRQISPKKTKEQNIIKNNEIEIDFK
jgi:hypothetical protein